jgi:hypothetical protein
MWCGYNEVFGKDQVAMRIPQVMLVCPFPLVSLITHMTLTRNTQGPLKQAVSNGCVPLVNIAYFTFAVKLKFRVIQGKGIIHAEMPVHGKGVPEPRGLQLWVDLPKEVRPLILLCARINPRTCFSLRWW